MKKKAFMATIMSVLLASTLTGAILVNVANANPLPQNPVSPPPIVIQSPLNSTYYQNDILLNFTIVTASTYSPMVYHLEVIYYRIDEKPVWLYSNPDNYQPNKEQFSANLTGLSKGEHTLTVYVDGGGLYYINNSSQIEGYSVESTQTVTFTVAKDLETIPSLIAAIQSPLNQTYTTDTVTVNVTAHDTSQAIAGISYVLDANYEPSWVGSVTIYTNEPRGGIFSHEGNGIATLSNLSNGQHHLIVTVREWMLPQGYSDIKIDVYFSVQKPASEHSPSPSETPKSTPTLAPTLSPSTSSYSSQGTSNVSISILSPENKTYSTSNIELAVNAVANPGIWNLLYSLDGGPLTDFTPQNWTLPHTFNGSIWLNGLSDGSHNLVAQTYTLAHNGSITAYSQVYFAIATALTTPSPSSTQQPTIEPISTASPTLEPKKSISVLPMIVGMTIVIILALAGALFYFRKRRG